MQSYARVLAPQSCPTCVKTQLCAAHVGAWPGFKPGTIVASSEGVNVRRDAFDSPERERTRILIARAAELRKRSSTLIGRSLELRRRNGAVRKQLLSRLVFLQSSQRHAAGAP